MRHSDETLSHRRSLLIAAGSVTAAHAEGFCPGGSLGTPDWNNRIGGIDDDGHGTAAKLYGGYAFTPNFALEAGAMRLGEARDASGKVKADGAYLDAVGTWSVAKDWSLLGRAGVAHATFKGPSSDSSLRLKSARRAVRPDLERRVARRNHRRVDAASSRVSAQFIVPKDIELSVVGVHFEPALVGENQRSTISCTVNRRSPSQKRSAPDRRDSRRSTPHESSSGDNSAEAGTQ